jgi:hypothetical protein
MEQLLLPFKPTSPLAKVPYVAHERYDGLSFLEYAKRKGKFTIEPASADGTYVPMQAHDSRFPPPASEQEPFFQTWLFFGLLSEFFQGNVADESQISPEKPSETLDFLYTNFINEEDGKQFVTTAKFLPIIDTLLAQPDEDEEQAEALKLHINHLSVCLRYAAFVLWTCAEDFNPDIKWSIAALGESLMFIVSSAQQELGMELDAFCMWTKGSFSLQMREQMLSNGWCISDIKKCSNTFDSVQALHMLSKIGRSQPPRDHSSCTEQVCRAGQIDLGNYKVGHVKEGCNCKLLTIDDSSVVEILTKEDLFPILKIHGGEVNVDDLKIDIIESAASAHYVAISHVSCIFAKLRCSTLLLPHCGNVFNSKAYKAHRSGSFRAWCGACVFCV